MVDMAYIGDAYGRVVETIITDKIKEMSSSLYDKGEFFLSEVLLDIAVRGSRESVEELHKMGYYLELFVPEFEKKWDEETEVYTMRANLEEITVTLKRMIMKV